MGANRPPAGLGLFRLVSFLAASRIVVMRLLVCLERRALGSALVSVCLLFGALLLAGSFGGRTRGGLGGFLGSLLGLFRRPLGLFAAARSALRASRSSAASILENTQPQ